MKLLIDSGNTRCKYALVENGKITRLGVEDVLNQIDDIAKIVYSDVSSSEELYKVITKAKDVGVEIFKVSTQASAFGVRSGYSNFETLGVDRWLGVLAADYLFPNQPCIIVDAGTAMTIDVIDHQKSHLGGWIVPGLNLMETSIENKAPHVFSSSTAQIESFGTTTPNALRTGVLQMAVGAVERATRLYHQARSQTVTPKVILTGGDAGLLREQLGENCELIPDLIFIGLSRF